MNKNKVITFCGEYPKDFVKEDIASDPNFVFVNDSTYPRVNVYDADGNVITVNSFQECEHYVMGGWDKEPVQLQETLLQYGLVFIVVGILITKYVIKRFILP